jgi:hypothetical protein
MKSKASTAAKDAPIQTSANPQRYQETWRVLDTTGGRPQIAPPGSDSDGTELKITSFKIRCYYIDFNGTAFFPVIQDFEIAPFESEVFIPSLVICPSRFIIGGEDIKADFRKTGEVFRDLTKFKSFYYSETTLVRDPSGSKPKLDEEIPEFIESPVIVDFSEALRSNPDWHVESDGVQPQALQYNSHETNQYTSFEFNIKKSRGKVNIITGDTYWTTDYDHEINEIMMHEFIAGNKFLKHNRDDINTTFEDLDEDDIVLLPPRVFGFVLRSRKFGQVPIKLCILKLTSVQYS